MDFLLNETLTSVFGVYLPADDYYWQAAGVYLGGPDFPADSIVNQMGQG